MDIHIVSTIGMVNVKKVLQTDVSGLLLEAYWFQGMVYAEDCHPPLHFLPWPSQKLWEGPCGKQCFVHWSRLPSINMSEIKNNYNQVSALTFLNPKENQVPCYTADWTFPVTARCGIQTRGHLHHWTTCIMGPPNHGTSKWGTVLNP